jgi:hypothetical protein
MLICWAAFSVMRIKGAFVNNKLTYNYKYLYRFCGGPFGWVNYVA